MITINAHAIEMGNEKEHELRTRAESHRKIYHYCTLDTLLKIIETQKMKLNNICRIKGGSAYEQEGIDSSLLDSIFVSCLTTNTHLWGDFSDNKRGARICFKCSEPLHKQMLDSTKMVEAYSEKDELIDQFGFNVSHLHSFSYYVKRWTTITVDIKLSDVEYTTNKPASTILFNQAPLINLSNIVRRVIPPYTDEAETRLIGILRSIEETPHEDIAYLLVPIDFNNITIEVDFGKKTNKETRSDLSKKLDRMGIVWRIAR